MTINDGGPVPSDIRQARKTFRAAFLDRSPGSLFGSYVANVAMLLHDRYGITDYETRNRAAEDVLDLLFGDKEGLEA